MAAESSGCTCPVQQICVNGPANMRKGGNYASSKYAWITCALPSLVHREESTIYAFWRRLT